MRYSEAFAKLGYSLISPRQDWTAESEQGVCITIWRSEMAFDGKPWFDSRLHSGPNAVWRELAGNKKRITHLKRAVDEFGGFVDVVIVTGIPGQGVDDASAWLPQERQGYRWKVTEFDTETGQFRVEAMPPGDVLAQKRN